IIALWYNCPMGPAEVDLYCCGFHLIKKKNNSAYLMLFQFFNMSVQDSDTAIFIKSVRFWYK
ncbi:MAG TPA: hypothetical protein DC049_18880, partial [Spirochaetia bacterium]|nr:hypothetical protein [Spirochaetia bacterium]